MANSEQNQVTAALDYLRSHRHFFEFDDQERVVRVCVADAEDVDALAAHISSLRDLDELSFFGTQLTDHALSRLRNLVNLKELRLEGSALTPLGLAHLSAMPSLEDLNIRDVGTLGLQAFESLARIPSLRKLTLSNGRFSDAELSPLARLVNLEELILSEAEEVCGTFCHQLTKLRSLKSLSLGEQITDEGLARIATLSGLVELFITGPFTDAGLAHWRSLRNVRTLAIDSESVSGEGVANVATLGELNRLWLNTPRLSDDVVEALLGCSALEMLMITSSSLSEAGLQKLRAGLPKCSVHDPSTNDSLRLESSVEHVGAELERLDTNTPFLQLLAKACDLDLVEGTFTKIHERYNHRIDATRYSPEESVIMLVWHSACCINFAGFEYLFVSTIPGDSDFGSTAEAYKTVGLDRDFAAFQQAFALFPLGVLPDDPVARYQLFQGSNQTARDQINQGFQRRGYDGSREKKLAEFIRKNAARLGDLDDVS